MLTTPPDSAKMITQGLKNAFLTSVENIAKSTRPATLTIISPQSLTHNQYLTCLTSF